MKLPWRKQFLAGSDLNGNTYWEFKDQLSNNPERMRRMVKGPRQMYMSDVQAQISPLWHQWLRQTRHAPPSLEEQHMDVQRQITLKHNAKLADDRWNSKKKYIEKPEASDELPPPRQDLEPRREMERQANVPDQSTTQQTAKSDPWERERQKQQGTGSNPGGGWQPEAWTPGRRR